jgi:hypothetical protein
MSNHLADLREYDKDGNPLVGNAGAVSIQQKILAAQIKSRGPAHENR